MMAYIAQSHVAIGDTWSAASHNTMIDNIASIYASNGTMGSAITALQASDITLSGLIAAISALPAGGTAYQGLRKNAANTTYEWSTLVNLIGRQGGSSTDWGNAGTSNYTPANAICQAGMKNVIPAGSGAVVATNASLAIIFPVAFSNVPIVLITLSASLPGGSKISYYLSARSASGFTIDIQANSSPLSFTGPIDFDWLAIGPK